MRRSETLARIGDMVAIPWNAFVAAFLYYSLLAVLALGGTSARGPVVAGAYGMPVAMWAVTVAVRLIRAGGARVAELAASPRLARSVG
jgi:hypothetical protein